MLPFNIMVFSDEYHCNGWILFCCKGSDDTVKAKSLFFFTEMQKRCDPSCLNRIFILSFISSQLKSVIKSIKLMVQSINLRGNQMLLNSLYLTHKVISLFADKKLTSHQLFISYSNKITCSCATNSFSQNTMQTQYHAWKNYISAGLRPFKDFSMYH